MSTGETHVGLRRGRNACCVSRVRGTNRYTRFPPTRVTNRHTPARMLREHSAGDSTPHVQAHERDSLSHPSLRVMQQRVGSVVVVRRSGHEPGPLVGDCSRRFTTWKGRTFGRKHARRPPGVRGRRVCESPRSAWVDGFCRRRRGPAARPSQARARLRHRDGADTHSISLAKSARRPRLRWSGSILDGGRDDRSSNRIDAELGGIGESARRTSDATQEPIVGRQGCAFPRLGFDRSTNTDVPACTG
jgi:hypothetical protein